VITNIMRITLVVRDQEEALRFYTEKLGFRKAADNPMGHAGRWLTVAAPGDTGLEVVLQPPDWFRGEARAQREVMIGRNPTLVLRVDDCAATCAELKARGVSVVREPEPMPFGVQAIIRDLYGNDLVLLQPQR
jgi:predicted enzyme related to lactoylglutathione lyase